MNEDIFGDSRDGYDSNDDWGVLNDRYIAEQELKELERVNFKKGKHTHAYREDLLNSEIIQMRNRGLTLEKIAGQLGCSVSTVRNRLNKLKAMNLLK